MFYLNLDILIKQLLPPNWRSSVVGGFVVDSGKVNYLKSILTPFKLLLNDIKEFRLSTQTKINLTAEVIVVENHLKNLSGVQLGVYLSDSVQSNIFVVNIPVAGQPNENEIKSFLSKIIPAGRKYTLNFY